MRNFLILLLALSIVACKQETKSKILEQVSQTISDDFPGKIKATQDINQLFTDYVNTFVYDSTAFDKRMALMSDKYFARQKRFAQLAILASKRDLQSNLASEQLAILGLRSSYSKDELTNLSTLEILRKSNEGALYLGAKDSEMKNLMFVSPNEALAGQKSAFAINPLTFHKENGIWKLDPLGDPIVQKMKEDKLISMSGKTKEAYLNDLFKAMGMDMETIWNPLAD